MWGEKENESFLVENLTANFSDNERIAVLRQADLLVLYVHYLRGSEDSIELRIAYSHVRDKSPDRFFEESAIRMPEGEVIPFYHRLKVSGDFRLALPLTVAEDRARVGIRATGVASGRVELFFVTNNLTSFVRQK